MGLEALRRAIARSLDSVLEWSGRSVAWLVVLLVLITVYDVLMRYVWQDGSVAIQELEWHLFAAIFLLAGGYTLRHDGHVRVDVFYRSRWFSERTRWWVDVLGTLFMLLPFCALVVWSSVPFVVDAWVHHETSPDPGGLPHRWLVKLLIPAGFSLLALQGLASLLHALGGPPPAASKPACQSLNAGHGQH